MKFYLNVKNGKIENASNEPFEETGYISIEVSQEVYYNFISHEDRYKFVAGSIVEDEEFAARHAAENEKQFKKDFFNSSLGYIRRKVSMATGETKDFLSDLLPIIAAGLQAEQPATIIAYREPDYSQEITDEYMITLQEQKTVTPDFVKECLFQVSKDFIGNSI